MHTNASWDIFCRVVDNYGDAAVCWRLAQQLAHEQRVPVRLWIDDLESLRVLQRDVSLSDRQLVAGVEVCRWSEPFSQVPVAGVVIDAFGCGLPDSYMRQMAGSACPPLWIVLEYLSAEPWVRDFHAQPSPHPQWPLERYFFFPGFVQGTGGLLLERDLFARRDAFGQASAAGFWRSVHHAAPPADATVVSLFSYETAPAGALLRAWERGATLTVATVPEGRLSAAVLRYFNVAHAPAERVLKRGSLEVRIMPFVPQRDFDSLLWSCDINFVRGEDSFVRAQWAARPFVWQAYAQPEQAHRKKVEAFLDLYSANLSASAAAAVSNMMRSWNGIAVPGTTLKEAWAAFITERSALRLHAAQWATRCAAIGPLAENLACFCRDKLK
jgi:uncharacterized repeat protein (TIGR03837 family)